MVLHMICKKKNNNTINSNKSPGGRKGWTSIWNYSRKSVIQTRWDLGLFVRSKNYPGFHVLLLDFWC